LIVNGAGSTIVLVEEVVVQRRFIKYSNYNYMRELVAPLHNTIFPRYNHNVLRSG
jgi:hypothetical protein